MIVEKETVSKSENVGKRVRIYLCLYLALLLSVIWSDIIASSITKSIGGKDNLELAQKIGASIVTILGALSVFITGVGRDLALHLVLDRMSFKVIAKNNHIIKESLREKASLSGVDHSQVLAVTANMQDVMFLFWHFVNGESGKFEALKKRANHLLEQYYVNIYAVFLGTVGMLASMILVIARAKVDAVSLIPVFFAVIVGSLWASTKYQLIKKIYAVPEQQIAEIGLGELKGEVERRFMEKDKKWRSGIENYFLTMDFNGGENSDYRVCNYRGQEKCANSIITSR